MQERQLITLEDAAVISCPQGNRKPKTRQLHSKDRRMNAYSKGHRIKAVGALKRGMPRKEVASTFGISLATHMRWLKRRQGEDLAPRPSPGRTPLILGGLRSETI